jgi:acetoin utilization protein AcuB
MFTSDLKTVADVMTRRLVTLKPDDVLGSIEQAMETLRVRHLPVVDGAGKLLGLVSHADIWHAASSVLSERESDRNAIINQVPVSRIMQTELLTVEPGDPLIDVAKLMWDCKVGCVPVVEADGTLVGILTSGDFIAIAVQLLGSEIKKSDVEDLARNRVRFARASA